MQKTNSVMFVDNLNGVLPWLHIGLQLKREIKYHMSSPLSAKQ